MNFVKTNLFRGIVETKGYAGMTDNGERWLAEANRLGILQKKENTSQPEENKEEVYVPMHIPVVTEQSPRKMSLYDFFTRIVFFD